MSPRGSGAHPDRIVVVGGGAAGATVVQELRRRGHEGPVVLLGEETGSPYDRPPLSKHVLSGEWTRERICLATPQRLAELDVAVRAGARAVGLDHRSRSLTLLGGEVVGYDALVVATGSRPVRPRWAPDHPAVRYLRTIEDAEALRDALTPDREVVVVGAGFLGLEVASVAAARTRRVTVVARETPLRRALGGALSDELTALHRENGVRVLVGARVRGIGTPAEGGRCQVVLDDERVLDADVVVVAVGATPCTDWLAGSGLEVSDGLRCDDRLVAAPGVLAVGDVARLTDPDSGTSRRVEHRTNATETAMSAAATLTGADASPRTVPFWWSDQHGSRLQGYGRPGAHDHLWYGHPGERRVVVLSSDGGRICGAVGMNAPRQLRQARDLVARRSRVEDVGTATDAVGQRI